MTLQESKEKRNKLLEKLRAAQTSEEEAFWKDLIDMVEEEMSTETI